MVADSALRSPEAILAGVEQFRDMGFDELILDPTVSDPEQVERLAEVVMRG